MLQSLKGATTIAFRLSLPPRLNGCSVALSEFGTLTCVVGASMLNPKAHLGSDGDR